MNEEKKKNKKKILTYYLILGACLLVIAAITVTVIFAVNGNKNNIALDTDNNITDNGDNSDNSDGDSNADNTVNSGGSQAGNSTEGSGGSADNSGTISDDNNTNVSVKYEFIAPIDSVDLINSYTFYKNNTLDYYHFHTGLDFAAEEGTEVFACMDGTVESITTGDLLDGTVITILHDNGVKTVYKFIDAKEGLSEGDSVKQGQVIGTIAQANGSEYKDGAHLHFEVYSDGKTANPEDYLDISAK
jgi:murein DD-endopeptidase MepM/ murein hydrolase activator NlpD